MSPFIIRSANCDISYASNDVDELLSHQMIEKNSKVWKVMRSYSHVLNNGDAENDILITLYLNCLAKISLILSQFSSSFLKNFQLMVNELASQLLIMLGQFFSYNLLFSKDLDNPVLNRSVSLTMHPVK